MLQRKVAQRIPFVYDTLLTYLAPEKRKPTLFDLA